jgi:NNMT/PNMT/TEMT family
MTSDQASIDPRFDTFVPNEYLNEYYSTVLSENNNLLRFLSNAVASLDLRHVSVLEYGGGPTVYQLISLAGHAESIHFTDHLESNLDEVKRWLEDDKRAHDWRPFVRAALIHEGNLEPADDLIRERETLLRSRMKSFGKVNAFVPEEDDIPSRDFDLVSACFVAESISSTRSQWMEAMSSICTYVGDDGFLLMTAIRNASYWVSGGKRYPGYPINRRDVLSVLNRLGLYPILVEEVDAEVTDSSSDSFEGYDGMIFSLSRRTGDGRSSTSPSVTRRGV